MPSVLAPLNGRATVGLELVADDGGREQLLNPAEFGFESAVLVDDVEKVREWTLHLRATSRAVYERKITPLLLSAKRRLAVRWGVDTGTGVTWGATDLCRVVNGVAHMQNNAAGSSFAFELVLVGPLYDLDLDQKVAARRGRVSEIVEAIAKAYGLEPMVEATGGVPLALVQSYQSDLQFIRQRLRPAAVNAGGVSGYYFYSEGGILHFHTRAYRQEPLILPYNPAASNLMLVDDVQERAAAGGAGTEIVVYDPLSGRTLITDVDPSLYVKFGRRLSRADGKALWTATAGPNQTSFEVSRAHANYSLNRDRYGRISFSAVNMLELRAGRLVTMQLPNSSDSANGYYHIDRVHLAISGGAATASATAARGEINGGRQGEGSVRGADSLSGNIPGPSDAPGRDPNFSTQSPLALGQGASVAVRSAG